MAGDFRLYVGADLIVRALSEHYVPEPDQMTRNTLLVATRMGAKLILTEPVIDEVVHHFRRADAEYRRHIDEIEHRLTYDIAQQVPQIMLRAYLYARMNPNLAGRRPRCWQAFGQQFCSYETLHRPSAFDDLRQYLQVGFGLSYSSTAELESLVDLDQVSALADRLLPVKKDPRLARNDALMALAVYGLRRRSGETSRVMEFGWGTWLTPRGRTRRRSPSRQSAVGQTSKSRPRRRTFVPLMSDPDEWSSDSPSHWQQRRPSAVVNPGNPTTASLLCCCSSDSSGTMLLFRSADLQQRRPGTAVHAGSAASSWASDSC